MVVKQGDVIVAGSDGLLDNLSELEILEEVCGGLQLCVHLCVPGSKGSAQPCQQGRAVTAE